MALCASRAEKTNRFPWKEIMFGLHLRRPHKADQSPVCCVQQGEEEEEEEEHIWSAVLICACPHTRTHINKCSDTLWGNVRQEEDLRCFMSSAH